MNRWNSPISPLRIAVVGAGNIGSTFAFHLARTKGHEVTVVGRPQSSRLAQLRRDGAIVDDGEGGLMFMWSTR